MAKRIKMTKDFDLDITGTNGQRTKALKKGMVVLLPEGQAETVLNAGAGTLVEEEESKDAGRSTS